MGMAPVAYMPAATMNSTATVSMPWLLNPLSNSSAGASFNVSASASAPVKTAGAGILVLISSTKTAISSASVR